jgi:hypothetical protein
MPTADDLMALQGAVMLASDSHEGRHLLGFVVVSAWALDADPDDVLCDVTGAPPDQVPDILASIKRFL